MAFVKHRLLLQWIIKVRKMPVGFVLITTETGKERSVRAAIEAVDLVTQRWGVFGDYDMFIKVEADDQAELTRCIINEIRTIDGVLDTRTLMGAEI
jgi:DNA-binding Lrp family transcriptional regulator